MKRDLDRGLALVYTRGDRVRRRQDDHGRFPAKAVAEWCLDLPTHAADQTHRL